MPKGNPSQMNGRVCNVPTERIGINCISLSQLVDSNGIVIVHLKSKTYCDQVLFKRVRRTVQLIGHVPLGNLFKKHFRWI